MVRIRLTRVGRPHLPVYRIAAIEKRVKRDGRILENLGWYSPTVKDKAKQLHLEVDRIKHWLALGAQPSDTMKDILAAHNIIDAEVRKAEIATRAKAVVAARALVAANPQPDPKAKKEAKKV